MKNTEIYPTYPMKKRSLKGVLLRGVALLMVLGTAHVTGNVYGGGNAAPVTGSTSVTIQD